MDVTERVSITLPRDTLAALDAAARTENRNRSNMISHIISDYLGAKAV